jgi:hypothetical protein
MQRLLPSVVTMLILVLTGCGRGDRPILAPVSGAVTYNGRPLARGRITFHPEQGRSASGKIVDGKITEVTTVTLGDGAVVGRHKVQICSFVREPQGMELVPWAIPERYGNVATSGLTAEVIAGKQNAFPFELHD